jgi:hypothetical protein
MTDSSQPTPHRDVPTTEASALVAALRRQGWWTGVAPAGPTRRGVVAVVRKRRGSAILEHRTEGASEAEALASALALAEQTDGEPPGGHLAAAILILAAFKGAVTFAFWLNALEPCDADDFCNWWLWIRAVSSSLVLPVGLGAALGWLSPRGRAVWLWPVTAALGSQAAAIAIDVHFGASVPFTTALGFAGAMVEGTVATFAVAAGRAVRLRQQGRGRA